MIHDETPYCAEWSPCGRDDSRPASNLWRLNPSADYSRPNSTHRCSTPLPYGLAYDYSGESRNRSPDSYGLLKAFTPSLPDLHDHYNPPRPLPRPDEFLFATCRSESPTAYLGNAVEPAPQSNFDGLHGNPPLTASHQLSPTPCLQPQSPEKPQPTATKVTGPQAHVVPPGCHSSYSELTPNLDFLKKLQQEALPTIPETRPAAPKPPPFKVPVPRPRHILPSTARIPKRPDPLSHGVPGQVTAPKKSPAGSQPEKGTQSLDSTGRLSASNITRHRNTKEPRKPSLACMFCRERKIACGRPPIDSEDQTCNQCLRRSFKCEYRDEPLRRGSGALIRR